MRGRPPPPEDLSPATPRAGVLLWPCHRPPAIAHLAMKCLLRNLYSVITWHSRPMGIPDTHSSARSRSAGLSRMRGVSTMPGEMQLTLTPRDAHSHPRDCVSLTTADLDALYTACHNNSASQQQQQNRRLYHPAATSSTTASSWARPASAGAAR